MNQDFSFRMMQGKGGKSGHIRKEGQQVSLSFRHLPPSLSCTLYRDGHVVDTRPSSLQGTLQFTCHRDGFFFLCHENNLLLWEEGENGSQNYFRAQRLIPRLEKPTDSAPVSPSEPPVQAPQIHEPPNSPVPIPANEPQHMPEVNLPTPFNDETTPEQAAPLSFGNRITPPIPVSQPANTLPEKTQPKSLPPPILKPRSSAPSVMTLPALPWPPALTHLQALFNTGTPYRPFWKPEFRCVKVPAKNPALPYSIMGYQVRNGRVCALLQAVPGHPLIPPRGFEGAPYRDGHFIRIHPLPQK